MRIHPAGHQAKIRIVHTPIDLELGHLAPSKYDIEGYLFRKDKTIPLNNNYKLEIFIPKEVPPQPSSGEERILIDLVHKSIIRTANNRYFLQNLTLIKKDDSSEGILIGRIRRLQNPFLMDADIKLFGVMPFIPDEVEFETMPSF